MYNPTEEEHVSEMDANEVSIIGVFAPPIS
jgi:hypothetical protein